MYMYKLIIYKSYNSQIAAQQQHTQQNIIQDMQILSRMNQKMDQGYLVTNFPCKQCNGVTLMNKYALVQKIEQKVYCPKCDKQYNFKEVMNDDEGENNQLDQIQQELKEYQKIYGEYQDEKGNKQQGKIQSQASTPASTKLENSQSKLPKIPLDPNQAQAQYQQFLAQHYPTTKVPSHQKTAQISKKLGQKLISGWAMLQHCCQDCNAPLMKSKKGLVLCVGCQREFQVNNGKLVDKTPKQKKQTEKKQATVQKTQQPTIPKLAVCSFPPSTTTTVPKLATCSFPPQTSTVPKLAVCTFPPSNQSTTSSVSNPTSASIPFTNPTAPVTSPYFIPHPHPIHPHPHNQPLPQLSPIITRSLQYLQSKLQQAIALNDLETFDRIIRSVQAVRNLIN